MSRRNIIIAVIIVLLLGAAAGYYFLYYTGEPEQQLTEETTQVTQEQETPNDTSPPPETEGEDEGEDEAQSIEEELAQDVEIELPEKFAYRNEIRNPFGRIQEEQVEPEVTKEELTIPFRLDGIITNGNQQIAIITTQEGSRFISENESIGEFYISNVSDDQIRIRYKYLTVYMKIGGALVE
jgi:type II secretory pathway component PulC